MTPEEFKSRDLRIRHCTRQRKVDPGGSIVGHLPAFDYRAADLDPDRKFIILGPAEGGYLLAAAFGMVTRHFIIDYDDLVDLCLTAGRWPVNMELVRK